MPKSNDIVTQIVESLRQGCADGDITPAIMHYCETAPMQKVALPSVWIDWQSEGERDNMLVNARMRLVLMVDNARPDSVVSGIADSGPRDTRTLADAIRRYLSRRGVKPNAWLEHMDVLSIDYKTGVSETQSSPVAQAILTYQLKYKETN